MNGMEAGPMMAGAMPGPMPGQMLVLAPGEFLLLTVDESDQGCGWGHAGPGSWWAPLAGLSDLIRV